MEWMAGGSGTKLNREWEMGGKFRFGVGVGHETKL